MKEGAVTSSQVTPHAPPLGDQPA